MKVKFKWDFNIRYIAGFYYLVGIQVKVKPYNK